MLQADVTRPADSDLANSAEAGFLILLCLIAAALAMLPITRTLCTFWVSDPLRSFGALLPFVSCFLIVRAWRATGWRVSGTVWGLLPILLAVTVARLSDGVQISYRIADTQISPAQPGLLLFLFMSGAVLLLGGSALWRAALFPLCLLLCVDPIPHLFNSKIDLPLQIISANVARAFAQALGFQPTGEQLDIMFTPRFGMEIVPGCNGMRGAATMAYIALVLGYLRRYRPLQIAGLVTAAALTGYLLNFARLCALVLFDWTAAHFAWLQPYEWMADYTIGGTIILIVSGLTGWLWLAGDAAPEAPESHGSVNWPAALRRPSLAVASVLLAVLSLEEVPAAYASLRNPKTGVRPEDAITEIPATAGRWTRTDVQLVGEDGRTDWVWAKFRRDDGHELGFGIWLAQYQHFIIISARIKGLTPSWQGSIQTQSRSGVPATLASFILLKDTTTTTAPVPTIYAETTCMPDRCVDKFTGFEKHGLSLAVGPVAMQSQVRLSMAVRAQHPEVADISTGMRDDDLAAMRDLVSALDMQAITQHLGSR